MTNDEWGTPLKECHRAECANLPTHADGYHDADDDIINIAAMRGIEKLFDDAFENLREMAIEHLPHPSGMAFGSEVEDEDDLADDFADWATARIIRILLNS